MFNSIYGMKNYCVNAVSTYLEYASDQAITRTSSARNLASKFIEDKFTRHALQRTSTIASTAFGTACCVALKNRNFAGALLYGTAALGLTATSVLLAKAKVAKLEHLDSSIPNNIVYLFKSKLAADALGSADASQSTQAAKDKLEQDGCKVIEIEITSKDEISETIKNTPQNQKIVGIWFQAHGSEEGMEVSESETLTSENVNSLDLSRLESKGAIIFQVCYLNKPSPKKTGHDDKKLLTLPNTVKEILATQDVTKKIGKGLKPQKQAFNNMVKESNDRQVFSTSYIQHSSDFKIISSYPNWKVDFAAIPQ